MKRWNDTYRLRAVRDEQRRKKLEQMPPNADNLRKLRRLERRLGLE